MSLSLQHLEEHSTTHGSDVSIIRREFVELTGNLFSAVILNQLLYWTLRVKDFDYLIEEEKRFQPNCNVSPRHGWIYKTAQELNEETMLGLSPPSIRKYLKLLIDEGWIDEREHPTEKWNKTTQYRVNVRRLQEDLIPCGHSLPEVYLKAFGPSLAKCLPLNNQRFCEKTEEMSKTRIFPSNENPDTSLGDDPHFFKENLNQRNFASNERNFVSNEKSFASNERNFGSNEKIFASNTENTTKNKHKNTNKDHQQRPRARENFSNLEKMLVGESGLNDFEPNGSVPDESVLNAFVPDESGLDEPSLNKFILDKPVAGFVPDKATPDKPVSEEFVENEFAADEPVPDASAVGRSAPNTSPTHEPIADEIIRLWERHVVESCPLTKEREDLNFTDAQKDLLASLFAFHFQNDMRLWEQFCLRTKTTPFMMGGGVRKWFVSLKWLLREDNLIKALEGKYESSNKPVQQNSFEHKLDQIQATPVNDAEKAAIIRSIKDPVWKKWCSRLAQGVRLNDFKMLHEPLSVLQLQEIANARFIECEDERLVWIGCPDQKVLNTIENLRLKISWVFANEYPKATSLRTRLEPVTHHQSTDLRGSSPTQGQSFKRSELE